MTRMTLVRVAEIEVVMDARRAKKVVEIRGPGDVYRVLGARLARSDREKFMVLHLDARHNVLSVVTVSVGSLNASIVHPREVFKAAILANACAIVCVHNHPSGETEPSEEDLSITKRLVAAGDTLGIGVMDHVIIAGKKWTSLRERGAL